MRADRGRHSRNRTAARIRPREHCLASDQMTLDIEGVVDGGVGGEKPLRRSWWLEALHPSFSLPNRQMRILSPIVTPCAGEMFLGHTKIAQCSTVGGQLVSYKGVLSKARLLQQCAHQLERCFLVAPGLNKDVQHLALTVHSAPQIHSFPVDRDKHLIQARTPIWPGSQASQLAGIVQPELQRPTLDRFIGQVDTASCQKVFHVAVAERKSEL